MSVLLKDLMQALDEELQPQLFRDYCPNGLQVEGKNEVKKIITGVTACQALIDKAVELKADAILVHHGYFWKGEDASVVGMKKRRIETLLKNDISLIAYHLPLDGHPTMGNNAQLAKLMGWQEKGGMEAKPRSVGSWGEVDSPLTLDELGRKLEIKLGRKPLLISGGDHPVKTLAWCTGGAQKLIEDAAQLGVDAYVSGEISESTVHFARENGIHYISAGHHATERYGVQALGKWLEDKFGVEHINVDIDSPV
ncbi:Nif3-like dinuclear metal center hexameric protein [Endozoicomonas sp. OPT23]|uniref:Nif3-like dinuclear metal center hexameric protein n=1 Tax=Endozoicomonas sp. OPT23 TaxID=2072845 RepID=UPI00129A1FA5|nr:Nif3-like dinuclear metal center hexameric protein [Endozoicomonas sp. OPT23]MRI34097.1 Nif3-like dinuclear metal center hexameric protein [Endozoicomonas sp. OPT23]